MGYYQTHLTQSLEPFWSHLKPSKHQILAVREKKTLIFGPAAEETVLAIFSTFPRS